MRLPFLALLVLGSAVALAAPPESTPNPWTMFGGTPGRNMVNLAARDIPAKFDSDKDCLWKVDLGHRTYTQPVVAGGAVLVGTNNERPRNKRDIFRNADGEIEPLDKGVLMCFDEKTGAFRWQAVFDVLPGGPVNNWPWQGTPCTPTVEGERVYLVSNRCTVVCLDLAGFANGNQGMQTEKYQTATDADVLWEYDMRKELGVFPHNMSACSPLIVGDRLFVCTSNGVDEGHATVPAPDAPSFIALDKHTGKLLWKDNSPGKDIMHGQWSCAAYSADPVPQVIFPGGDGWVRAFDPPTGTLLWKFDGNPKDGVYELGGSGTKNDFIAAPVVSGGRMFLAQGQDPEHSAGIGRLWCLDLKKAVEGGAERPDRDVSPELLLKREERRDGPPKVVTAPNPSSAVAWQYGGPDNRPFAPQDFQFGRSMSTVCVVGDILYIREFNGFVHCLDARTGKHYWRYDTKAGLWNAAYYADGKVFVGNDNGDLYVWRHTPTPEIIDDLDPNAIDLKAARMFRRARHMEIETKYLLAKIEFDTIIRSPVSVANGVLFVATETTLYAIGKR